MASRFESSSSDSDSDSEIIEFIARTRRTNVRPNQFETLGEEEFWDKYRITKATALLITECIQSKVASTTEKNNALEPSEQLLLALRFYATGSFQQIVGDAMKTHKSTVCRAVFRVSVALAEMASIFIYMPQSQSAMNQVAVDFYAIGEFPKVIGAIDCTHIPIQSPGGETAELYRCRKGFFSLNVQTVVDSKLKIRDIVCRWPGSAHDSTIFDQSSIKQRMENGEFPNMYLLGDGGYSQLSYLMTPFREPRSAAEGNYNASQIKTRNTVERSYGVWKRRFPCLSSKLRVKRGRMEAVIVATAVIFNICREQNDPDFEENSDSDDTNDSDDDSDEEIDSNQAEGNMARRNVVRNFFTRSS